MSNGYVVYVNDTETTGLDCTQHEIIEASFFRLIPKDSGYLEEQRTWLVRAMNAKTISDEALAKNGHKREDILHLSKFGKENYLLPQDAVAQIEDWMMEDDVSSVDRLFVGQNPNFDLGFLKALWSRTGRDTEDQFPFFGTDKGNRVIDIKEIVAFFDLCTGRRRKYYNLSSLVKSLGVKKGKAHRGDEDTRMTKDLLLKLITFISKEQIENFKSCYADDE